MFFNTFFLELYERNQRYITILEARTEQLAHAQAFDRGVARPRCCKMLTAVLLLFLTKQFAKWGCYMHSFCDAVAIYYITTCWFAKIHTTPSKVSSNVTLKKNIYNHHKYRLGEASPFTSGSEISSFFKITTNARSVVTSRLIDSDSSQLESKFF